MNSLGGSGLLMKLSQLSIRLGLLAEWRGLERGCRDIGKASKVSRVPNNGGCSIGACTEKSRRLQEIASI